MYMIRHFNCIYLQTVWRFLCSIQFSVYLNLELTTISLSFIHFLLFILLLLLLSSYNKSWVNRIYLIFECWFIWDGNYNFFLFWCFSESFLCYALKIIFEFDDFSVCALFDFGPLKFQRFFRPFCLLFDIYFTCGAVLLINIFFHHHERVSCVCVLNIIRWLSLEMCEQSLSNSIFILNILIIFCYDIRNIYLKKR